MAAPESAESEPSATLQAWLIGPIDLSFQISRRMNLTKQKKKK